MAIKHLLSISDFSTPEILAVLARAQKLKTELQITGFHERSLAFKTLVMLFEKPSLRTRLSFEIGMTQLGGHAIYLAPSDIGLGTRESAHDVSKVISRMGDIVMARTFKHSTAAELAEHSSVPVINGLSDLEHPCQTMADLLTMLELKGNLKGLSVAYVGDANNNVAHSLALATSMLGMHLRIAAPTGYWMRREIAEKVSKNAAVSGGSILETTDPKGVVSGADVVYTDTWVSMGLEAEKEARLKIFSSFQVTSELMQLAKPDAIFMHDLPAYRGSEVAADVIDGPQSVVWQQAENRLHAQKSIMLHLLGL